MQKQTNINFKRRLVVAGLSALAFAVLMPVASPYAWGPDRPTYTMKKPADHATFNSITDNNVIGDERDFVRVAEKGGTKWVNEQKVVPGKTYQVYIFYHNNAATNTNQTNGGIGIAMKTKVRSSFPEKVSSSSKGTVSATISSTTSSPESVWDEAYFTTDSKTDVELKFVNASAYLYNQGKLNGTGLGRQIFSEGIYLGYNVQNGIIPGCSEYSGHIIYEVRAEQASSKVSKAVSLDGKNFFSSVTAKPGDEVTYKITFTNTGTQDLNNLSFRDKLPSGVTLVPDSVYLYDTGSKKTQKLSNSITANGSNVGLIGEGVTATITYKVKIASNIVDDGNCGTNSFKNTVSAKTDQTGTKTATATVKIEKICKDGTPPPTPTPDPCLDDKGNVKSECCDKEEYKDLPQCKEEEKDPCLDDEGNVKSECCDKEEYKDLPQCKEEEKDPCLDDEGNVKTECCDKEEYKDLPQCKEEEPEPAFLPNTGPGEIALAIVAAFCVITGVTYWYRSQKEVSEIQKEIKNENHKK